MVLTILPLLKIFNEWFLENEEEHFKKCVLVKMKNWCQEKSALIQISSWILSGIIVIK